MKGDLKIEGLSEQEFKAAMRAVKLVRGDAIKNAYKEGFQEGWEQCRLLFRGARSEGDHTCWENSHAKALSDFKVDSKTNTLGVGNE